MSAARKPKETRRRLPLRYLALGLAGVLLAAGSVWAVNALGRLQSMQFTRLEVSGRLAHTAPDRVRQAALPYLRKGFLGVDMDGLKHAVEALPWVARARLRREWPGVMHVRITEQSPVAVWNDTGLMNGYGEVFAPHAAATDSSAGLPRLSGPPGTQALLLEAYTSMQPPLAARGKALVRLNLSERRAWTLGLRDGVQVRLGREDAERRLREFSRIALPALRPRWGRVAYIDMRYTNGFAVGWKHDTTGAG